MLQSVSVVRSRAAEEVVREVFFFSVYDARFFFVILDVVLV